MASDLFGAWVADFQARSLPSITPRTVSLPLLRGKVDALVGMRRVGKTWRVYQQLAQLLDDGVPKERLLYVNLEDERLVGVGAEDLGGLLDAWYARHPSALDGERWLCLDEVQNVVGWERFVRRVLDQGDVRLLVTGSSSRMLSEEIATSLRGRALSTEILPYSFAEALLHAGQVPPTAWPPSTAERARLVHAFGVYFESGGFPEVQGLDAALRRRVLQEYIDVALLRDVVERHEVTQVHALRWLVRRLLAHPAGRFTSNRLYRDLKSQGLKIGKDAVHQLVEHVEDAHLLYTVPIWAASFGKRRANPRKAYPVDPALARTVAFAKPEDVGHRLETLVYLQLRRRGCAEVGYVETASGYEVDFCSRSADGTIALTQVCAELGAEGNSTRERELRALDEAMAEMGLDEATLVTLREEEHVRLARGAVRVVPAWRWLLEG
jgi:predicted AAA+ superfamily ATPase